MLLHSRPSSVEVSDGFESSSFTIVDSHNSFALLQGKQYTNPVEGTLRALVENALDAHADARCDEKIVVSANQNAVFVQDKGLGISPSDFENHFTTFFASNRTHSNQYHGFFGVGAKAPFGVACEFNVDTIHEGIKYAWICRRGNPAPTAQLLNTQPVQDGTVGTTITVHTNKMDTQWRDRGPWCESIHKLARWMPTHIAMADDVARVPFISSMSDPVLLIGGMPYPCPSHEVLGLPFDCYRGVGFSWMETRDEDIALDKQAKSNFGKSMVARAPRERILTTDEHVTIHLNIGDVELHFSKERVATTPANIQLIRDKLYSAWLGLHLKTAQYISTHKHQDQIQWRMSENAAQALKAQGHPPGLLAWARRPQFLQGPAKSLDSDNPTISIALRHSDQKLLSHKRWSAAVVNETEVQMLQDWAREWGIALQWAPSASKNNIAHIHARRSFVQTAQLAQYTTTVDKMLPWNATKNVVVLTVDDEWGQLDKTTKSHIQTWYNNIEHPHNMPQLWVTAMTLQEVQVHVPQAMSFKHYCQELLNRQLSSIADDALGLKTVGLSNLPLHRLAGWAQTQWKDNLLYTRIRSENAPDTFNAMHTWLDVPKVQYVDVQAWMQEQTQKLPLLQFMSPHLTNQQEQHLNQLVAHP